MKVIENKRMPLKRASDIVWEALGQLRELVNALCIKNTVKDRKLLERLLKMINKAFYLRSSGSMDSESGQSEPAEKRRSFGSDSTAVNGGLSSDIQTSEDEDGFGRARSLLIPRATTDLQPGTVSDSLPSLRSRVQVTPAWGSCINPSVLSYRPFLL